MQVHVITNKSLALIRDMVDEREALIQINMKQAQELKEMQEQLEIAGRQMLEMMKAREADEKAKTEGRHEQDNGSARGDAGGDGK